MLLPSTEISVQCSAMTCPGKEAKKRSERVFVCVTESLCRVPGTNITEHQAKCGAQPLTAPASLCSPLDGSTLASLSSMSPSLLRFMTI